MKENCKKSCSTWFDQIVAHSCRNLTRDDSPRNGGVVCYWDEQQNSQYCSVLCNAGYEHPTPVNHYEVCGPHTQYQWSHWIRNDESSEPSIPDCVDIDECLEDNGGCDQECVNIPGSYRCLCTQIPGYIVDPQDKTKCIVQNSCRNLTRDGIPRNGGIVCYWNEYENSQYCSVRCNPGYEHATGANDYETCGPSTQWQWSHWMKNDESSEPSLSDCIEAFFPDVTMEPDIFYFDSSCADLTHSEQEEERSEFADVLNDKTTCYSSPDKLCDVQDTGIICGESD